MTGRRGPRSLRARMALAIALVGALVSCGIGVTVYVLSEQNTIARARGEIATQVTIAATIARRSAAPVPGTSRDDPDAPTALQAAVRRGLLGTDRIGDVLWAGTPLSPGHGIYVRSSLVPELTGLRILRDDLIAVGALATLASAVLGALLAAGLSRRLVHAATTADAIAAGDLSARVDAGGEDEIARLGEAIDGMAGALSDRIALERRFSADVAHELRTPLTALVSASALLGEERPAAIVRERVGALRELVEDLLEIARLDAGAETVQAVAVDLAALARQLVAADPESGAELVTDEGAVITSDPRRVERILANLLANAHRHGEAPITVTVAGRAVSVTDRGPGYPEPLLRDGPRPVAAGTLSRGSGSGLGLVIALAQAQALGATLTLGEAEGGGAEATLRLPRSPAPARGAAAASPAR